VLKPELEQIGGTANYIVKKEAPVSLNTGASSNIFPLSGIFYNAKAAFT